MLGFKKLEWTWNIVLVSKYVTTMTQLLSYDFNQFVAKLIGGSWGFFLAASLLAIFDVVDRLLARVFLKGTSH